MASARICLQWTLIVYNTLSVIIGILAILAAVYDLLKYSEGSAERSEKIVQLSAACVLVVSAFVGCGGAINGSIKILGVFIGILVALITTHIWKLWRYSEAKLLTATDRLVTSTWIEEFVRLGSMSELQKTYSCCGKNDYTDYTSSGLQVPASCYSTQSGNSEKYLNNIGCRKAITDDYLMIYRYEKLAHWSLIGFECLGILLSSILICKLMVKSRTYRY